MPKIAFTGFEPFQSRDYNPSATVADFAARRVNLLLQNEGVATSRVLPVTYRAAETAAVELLTAYPSLRWIVHFGLAGNRSHVSIERHAANLLSDIPDNEGIRQPGTILDGVGSRFPPLESLATTAIADCVRSFEVQESADAGGYVCNAILFHSLGTIESRSPRTRVWFIHVPPISVADAAQLGTEIGDAFGAVLSKETSAS